MYNIKIIISISVLSNYSGEINGSHKGTKWTPLHCAAFQGHGKVVMTLMEYSPDLTLTDSKGRYKYVL